jgi:electron transport complex protein RnfE
MGIGFTLALSLIALIREVLGAGTISLFAVGSFSGVIEIPGLISAPVRVIGLAAGALLVMGYLIGLFKFISLRKEARA